MYITDLHADEHFCHEFDSHTYKYHKSFARKGKAPQELLSVGNFVADSKNDVLLLDVFARKIYRRNDLKIELLTAFPIDLGMVSDFTLYKDFVFIIPDVTGNNRLTFIDLNGKIIRNIGQIPDSRKINVPALTLAKAWRPFINYNPHNNIIAVATQLGDVLEIYNLQTGESFVTVGSDGEPVCKFDGINAKPDGVMGYGDVHVGDNYIYAVYWGHSIEAIKQGKIMEEGGELFRVFDLKGNPLKQYLLDAHITGFAVNESSGKVIATDPNNEQLVMFNIK